MRAKALPTIFPLATDAPPKGRSARRGGAGLPFAIQILPVPAAATPAAEALRHATFDLAKNKTIPFPSAGNPTRLFQGVPGNPAALDPIAGDPAAPPVKTHAAPSPTPSLPRAVHAARLPQAPGKLPVGDPAELPLPARLAVELAFDDDAPAILPAAHRASDPARPLQELAERLLHDPAELLLPTRPVKTGDAPAPSRAAELPPEIARVPKAQPEGVAPDPVAREGASERARQAIAVDKPDTPRPLETRDGGGPRRIAHDPSPSRTVEAELPPPASAARDFGVTPKRGGEGAWDGRHEREGAPARTPHAEPARSERPAAAASAAGAAPVAEPRSDSPPGFLAALAHAAAPVPPEGAPVGAAHNASAPVVVVRHEELARSIVAQARAVPDGGAVEVRFALQPADLGPVLVRIESRHDRISIELTASTREAAEMLASRVSHLTTELRDATGRPPDVHITVDAGADFGSRASHQDRQLPRGERGPSNRMAAEGPAPALASGREGGTSRLLDRMA